MAEDLHRVEYNIILKYNIIITYKMCIQSNCVLLKVDKYVTVFSNTIQILNEVCSLYRGWGINTMGMKGPFINLIRL